MTSRYLVTDFSHALMHACIQAMNEGMQLVAYLQLTHDVLSRRCTVSQIKNIMFLSLCAAHMLKALSMRLSRAVAKKDMRALALTYFAALQRTTDMEAAARTYRDIALGLRSRTETAEVSMARIQLEARVSGVEVANDGMEHYKPPPTDDDDDRTSPVDVGTLKSRSPFTAYFRSFIEDITTAGMDDDVTDNATFCRPAFAQVQLSAVMLH